MLMTACSSVGLVSREPQSTADLFQSIQKYSFLIHDEGALSSENCPAILREFSETFLNHPSGFFYPKDEQEKLALKTQLDPAIRAMTQIQFGLRSSFVRLKNPSLQCVQEARRAIRAARSIVDELLDGGLEGGVFSEDQSPAFSQGFPSVITNSMPADESRGGHIDLRSGDLLLTRSDTFDGAMIAQAGDSPTGFSHLALVAVDPQTHETFVIESTAAKGVDLVPAREWMLEAHVRTVVYRALDQDLARRAGEQTLQWVRDFKSRGETYPYDFLMNTDDHTQIYCAELVRVAFERASSGQVSLPEHRTTFDSLKDRSFMSDLGIRATTVFSPGDVEVDSHFALLGEFRRMQMVHSAESHFDGMSTLTQLRIQDATMESIFEWMSKRNYSLQPDPGAWALSKVAKAALGLGIERDQVQEHVPAGFIDTMVRLRSVEGDIESHLADAERSNRTRNGFSLSFQDLLVANESYRRQDCARFQKYLNYKSKYSSKLPSRGLNPNPMPDFHLGLNADGTCKN